MNELELIRNHFLGFHNDFFDSFRRVSTYPPYNIKEKDDIGVIEFAVAGFAEKDLKVEVKDQTCMFMDARKKRNQKIFITREYRIELSKKVFVFTNISLLMERS